MLSTSLVSKDKVFLDYNFLKEISDRIQSACKLEQNGKTMKARKELKIIDQELTDYFSKIDSFQTSKDCALVYGKYNASLECLPNINISWALGTSIAETLLEKFEDLKDDDSNLFFTGKFKLHFDKYWKRSYYFGHSFGCSWSSGVIGEKQKIDIYAIPISIEKQIKKWSGFQGNMPWNEAKAKCESIGMRLPTKEELEFAPREKWNKEAEVAEKLNVNKESGVMDFNAETNSYWALNKLIGFPSGTVEDNDELPTDEDFKTWKYSVRCIEGKEFKFKK